MGDSIDLTIYYTPSVLIDIPQGSIGNTIEKTHMKNIEQSCILFNNQKLYVDSIQFEKTTVKGQTTKYMYIKHNNPLQTKVVVYLRILLSPTDGIVYTKLDKLLENVYSDPKSVLAFDLKDLIKIAIPDKSNIKKKKKDEIYFVDFKTLKVSNALSDRIGDVSTEDSIYNDKDMDPEYTKGVKASISDKPTSTVQNCVRKGSFGPKGTGGVDIDKTRRDLSITALVLFFATIIIIVVLHLFQKGEDTDFFGNRLPEMGEIAGGGISMMVGGKCSIPDMESFKFQLPKPNLMGYFKMSTFLLFLNTLIFGSSKARVSKSSLKSTIEEQNKARAAFIPVSIVILVLGFAVIYFFNEYEITGGMDILSLLVYDKEGIAKYAALLGYLIFYTHFIKLVQNDVELPEFLLFMLNFLLLSGYAIFASSNNVNKVFDISVIIMVIVMVILNTILGSILIKDLVETGKENRDNVN